MKLQKMSYTAGTKLYAGLLGQLCLEKNLVRYRCLDQVAMKERSLLCLLESLWHDALTVAHMAADSTLQRLRTTLYFPSMRKVTQDFVRGCRTCQA